MHLSTCAMFAIMENGQSILQKFILISTTYVVTFKGLRLPEPLVKSFAGGKWKKSKNSSDIYNYKFNMSSSLEDFVPLNPWIEAFPLDPTWASSQTSLQARSTALAQILPSYIKLSRPFRSFTTISASLRETLQDLFHPMHLMPGISCLSMFLLPRRCQFSEGKHNLFLHAYLGSTVHRPSKSEFLKVLCRPTNAFQPSAYN